MQYRPFRALYDCDDCTKDAAKKRGCNRAVKELQIRVDCTCGGIPGCDICARPLNKKTRKKVSWGYFFLNRCPAKYSREKFIDRFLPYFWHWKGTDNMQYPDNQGRIEQPSIMLEAFSICAYVAMKREQAEIENMNKMNKPKTS